MTISSPASTASFINRFDLYRKIPRDLTEPTFAGAVISLLTMLLAAGLFYTELCDFMEIKLESSMNIHDTTDISFGNKQRLSAENSFIEAHSKIQINLDITFSRLPCIALEFDATDVLGSHEVDVTGHLFTERLDADGNILDRSQIKASDFNSMSTLRLSQGFRNIYENEDDDSSNDDDDDTSTKLPRFVTISEMKEALSRREGCRVKGHVKVNRVPGNLHFSTHLPVFSQREFIQNMQGGANRPVPPVTVYELDVSHVINHLSFGSDDSMAFVKSRLSMLNEAVSKGRDPSSTASEVYSANTISLINPLDGMKKTSPPRSVGSGGTYPLSSMASFEPVIFEYYLKVVPSVYVTLNGKYSGLGNKEQTEIYQITANSNIVPNPMKPSLYFRYDFSPVSVRYKEVRGESIFKFLVHICAILGGVFTIAGLVDSAVYSGIKHIVTKNRLGKLG